MQTLTIKDLVEGNRKALDEGYLAALYKDYFKENFKKEDITCLYRYNKGETFSKKILPKLKGKTIKCGIGVCLTDKTINYIRKMTDLSIPIEYLQSYGIIIMSYLATRLVAKLLQLCHDSWLENRSLLGYCSIILEDKRTIEEIERNNEQFEHILKFINEYKNILFGEREYRLLLDAIEKDFLV